jgi:hypothetical protein
VALIVQLHVGAMAEVNDIPQCLESSLGPLTGVPTRPIDEITVTWLINGPLGNEPVRVNGEIRGRVTPFDPYCKRVRG